MDFALKVLNWDAKSVVRLQLWDIAGACRDFILCARGEAEEAAGV